MIKVISYIVSATAIFALLCLAAWADYELFNYEEESEDE